MPPTLPAWKVTDDGEGYVNVYHAATAHDALTEHLKEWNLEDEPDVDDWFRTERCEAMDGLEPTLYNCMCMGIVSYAEEWCLCGATIYAEPGPDGELSIYTMDREYGREAKPVVLSGESGEIYCSRECLWKSEGVDNHRQR